MGTRKGITAYAKTDFDCLQCNTTLKAGERTPHQTLCSTGRNTTTLSRCQVIWYNKKKISKRKELRFIYCDICRKKQKQVDVRQVRCVSGVAGVLSKCQQIAKDRAVESFRKKKEEDGKDCLKCGNTFPSKGDYNRICDSCSKVNNRVTSTPCKVMVAGHAYC